MTNFVIYQGLLKKKNVKQEKDNMTAKKRTIKSQGNMHQRNRSQKQHSMFQAVTSRVVQHEIYIKCKTKN